MSDQDQAKRDIAAKLSEMLQVDPLEEARKAAAAQAALREEEERAARIEAARAPRLKAFEEGLKRDVSDQEIDARLQRRFGSEGGSRDLLPAQRTKERVEERLRYAGEMMGREAPDANAVSQEWRQHVDGLNLDARERIRYTNEAEGKQLTSDELNDLEARAYAHSGESDGVHGPSERNIEELIATAKSLNNWPPPELHTGPGSRRGREEPSFDYFEHLCKTPPDRANEKAEVRQPQATASSRASANASSRGGTLVGRQPSGGRQARPLAGEKSSGELDVPRRGPGMFRRIVASLAKPIIRMMRRLEIDEPMRAPPQAGVIRNRRAGEARANAGQKGEDARDRTGGTADLMERAGSHRSPSKGDLRGVLDEGDIIADEHWRVAKTIRIPVDVPEKAAIPRLQNRSSQKEKAGFEHANPPAYEASQSQYEVTTNEPRPIAATRGVSPVAPSVEARANAATAARSALVASRASERQTSDLSR